MWNDTDLEMAELEATAAGIAAARKAGICAHNGVTGRMGASQHGYAIPKGFELMCWDCGSWFRSQGEWLDARDEVLSEWT